MKEIKYLTAFALVLFFFMSCKKESLTTYNVPDNIYFSYSSRGVITDSADISFATRLASIEDSIFMLPFMVTGSPESHDRTFRVVVDDTATTAIPGTHFILPETFTVHAGRVVDSLPIKLLRAPDLQTNKVILQLSLQPGGDFSTGIKSSYSSIGGTISALTFKLLISDMLVQDTRWAANFTPYFGAFSAKKIRLINEVTGMPLDYPANYAFDLNSIAKRAMYAIMMSQYLKDQRAAGNTIYDEDGTEMKMGSVYQ